MTTDYGEVDYAVKLEDDDYKIYIQCKEININGQRLTKNNYLPNRTSYSTRTGKKKDAVIIMGRLVYPSWEDPIKIKHVIDGWQGFNVEPITLEIEDATNTHQWTFIDGSGTEHDYLKGYVQDCKIQIKRSYVGITILFEECWT